MVDYDQIYEKIRGHYLSTRYGIDGHVNCMCTQKEKGDNIMNNIKINWRVSNIETSDYTTRYTDRLTEIRATCIGSVENIKGKVSFHDVASDIHKLLNNNITKPEIKKVHFNPPATVVLWEDGTKTVVKAQEGDDYDPEKGLAMAISKKALGNQGNYYETIKKWCEPYQPKERSNYLSEYIRDLQETRRALALLKDLTSKIKEDDSNGH